MESIISNVTTVAADLEASITTTAGALGREVVRDVTELEDGLLDRVARIDTFPGSDVPGKDISVYTQEKSLETVDVMDYAGNYPHRCIATCLDTVWCFGVVTVSQKCWFRGGLVSGLKSPERVEGGVVPARDDYTVYVVHRASPLLGIALLAVLTVVMLCVCICICKKCCCRKPAAPPEPAAQDPGPPKPEPEPVTFIGRTSASLNKIKNQLGDAVSQATSPTKTAETSTTTAAPPPGRSKVAQLRKSFNDGPNEML